MLIVIPPPPNVNMLLHDSVDPAVDENSLRSLPTTCIFQSNDESIVVPCWNTSDGEFPDAEYSTTFPENSETLSDVILTIGLSHVPI